MQNINSLKKTLKSLDTLVGDMATSNKRTDKILLYGGQVQS